MTHAGGKLGLIRVQPDQMPLKSVLRNKRKRRLIIMIRVSLASTGFVFLKRLANHLGWDVLNLHPLFSALVAASVFLLSFLLNGVLSDYKESEKLPGELASALRILALEVKAISQYDSDAQIEAELESIKDLGNTIFRWIKGEVGTGDMMAMYNLSHGNIVRASLWLDDSSLKARLLAEMASILRSVNRIEVIRETDFSELVYLLAYASTLALCGGLVFIHPGAISEIDNASLLFVLSWILVFILHLISDLDNPFGFGDASSAEDVDLEILEVTLFDLNVICSKAC